MAHNLKDQINDLGKKVADNVGQAADWVKEKAGMAPKEGTDAGVAGIRPHMNVIASCGTQVGVVDRVEGGAIKLTKDGSTDGHNGPPYGRNVHGHLLATAPNTVDR